MESLLESTGPCCAGMVVNGPKLASLPQSPPGTPIVVEPIECSFMRLVDAL